ncbi:MAG: TetR/AcrR family transcriptional regulator [Lachnospiraceae bacterium]
MEKERINDMQDVSYIKNLTRRDYVVKAYEIVLNEGVEAVSIRRLAKELGCSSTSLYRHFTNLEELLFFAQIGFLKDYIEDLQNHETKWTNVWDMYIGIWECFSRQAFKTPKAFDCIFFGQQKDKLPQALREYYRMFPEGIQILSEHLQFMLQEGTFAKRDYSIALRCADAGVISLENATHLNRLCVDCFKGIFKGVLDEGVEDVEALVADVVYYVTDIVRLYASDLLTVKK